MLMATNEERLAALGVTLPPPFKDEANRVRALRSGNHIYMSGHGPLGPGNVPMMTGKLGRELSIPQGREAARLAGLCTLSTLRTYLGDLNAITRVVRVVGFITGLDHRLMAGGDLFTALRGSAVTHIIDRRIQQHRAADHYRHHVQVAVRR
jgi:hypothetical protein